MRRNINNFCEFFLLLQILEREENQWNKKGGTLPDVRGVCRVFGKGRVKNYRRHFLMSPVCGVNLVLTSTDRKF